MIFLRTIDVKQKKKSHELIFMFDNSPKQKGAHQKSAICTKLSYTKHAHTQKGGQTRRKNGFLEKIYENKTCRQTHRHHFRWWRALV